MEELVAPFAKVRDWMQNVADATRPHHQEVSKTLMKVTARLEQKSRRMQQSKL